MQVLDLWPEKFGVSVLWVTLPGPKMFISVPFYASDMLGAVIDLLLIEIAEAADYALLMETVISATKTSVSRIVLTIRTPPQHRTQLSPGGIHTDIINSLRDTHSYLNRRLWASRVN